MTCQACGHVNPPTVYTCEACGWRGLPPWAGRRMRQEFAERERRRREGADAAAGITAVGDALWPVAAKSRGTGRIVGTLWRGEGSPAAPLWQCDHEHPDQPAGQACAIEAYRGLLALGWWREGGAYPDNKRTGWWLVRRSEG
jgi:hypothetical protein